MWLALLSLNNSRNHFLFIYSSSFSFFFFYPKLPLLSQNSPVLGWITVFSSRLLNMLLHLGGKTHRLLGTTYKKRTSCKWSRKIQWGEKKTQTLSHVNILHCCSQRVNLYLTYTTILIHSKTCLRPFVILLSVEKTHQKHPSTRFTIYTLMLLITPQQVTEKRITYCTTGVCYFSPFNHRRLKDFFFLLLFSVLCIQLQTVLLSNPKKVTKYHGQRWPWKEERVFMRMFG